ncbi:MAG TPA: TOMM precursor leader peptide-binding protein, partial [Ktedonobacteraceae bacterium]|nr:TOMM precursor leader peptide-binding protein [Ktedonobacteraceae bacterium]
ARWISALRRNLNGQYTLDQICAGLEPAQRAHITQIISMLLERGIVKNSLPEISVTLPQEVQNHFRDQIDYIDHFVDHPQKHFKQFRESSLLLCGSGESLKALALSLVRNGVRRLSLATPDVAEDYWAALEPEITPIQQAGCEISLTLFPQRSPDTFETFAEYDAIIYCADRGSLKEIFALNQRCIAEKRMFLTATLFSGNVLLGPLVQQQAGPCWFCAVMRLSANSEDYTRADLWQHILLGNIAPSETLPSLPLARRIGYGLGFELFKTLSGCLPSETEHGVIFQILENLESSRSELVQHPCCPICGCIDHETSIKQLEAVINRSRDFERSELEIYEKHQHLFDPRLGLFKRFADSEVEQLPLKRSRIIGGRSWSQNEDELDVTAFSIDTPFTARLQALQKAISIYIQQTPPVTSIVQTSAQKLIEKEKIIIFPQDISGWSGTISWRAYTQGEWFPAFSVNKNSLVYVPAAAVYPCSSLNNQHIFQRTTAGAAIETTYQKVLTRGLLTALGNEYLQASLHMRSAVKQIRLETLNSLDADLHFLVQSARRFTRSFAVKKIVIDAPLTLVVAHTTDTTEPPIRTIGLGLSGRDALKAALLDLVGSFQMGNGQGLLPFPLETKLLENLLAWDALEEDARIIDDFCESDDSQLQIFLQQAGRDILFVHTTSADIWEDETFIGGKVLLTRTVNNRA